CDVDATSGEVNFGPAENGAVNIFDLSSQKKRYVRNHLMGMVYQNPRDGLNFRFSSGGNIAEKLLMAGTFHVGTIRIRASDLLNRTEARVPRMDDPPPRFSGGR